MTVRRQMILLIAGPTLIIYVAIILLTLPQLYRDSLDVIRRSTSELALSYAARFDGHLRESQRMAETTARFQETVGQLTEEQIYKRLETNLAQSPIIYGSCMAFEPEVRSKDSHLFAPYVCRDGQGYRRLNIDETVYDWYREPNIKWFSSVKSSGKGVWSDPYFDEGAGNVLMSTYSAPFSIGNRFAGVATVDIDLPSLRDTVGKEFESLADFSILSASGQFIYDNEPSRIMSQTIYDLAAQTDNSALSAIADSALSHKPGSAFIESWDGSQQQWVFFAPIESSGWVFLCRIPESQIIGGMRQRALWSAGGLAAALLLIVGCICLVSSRIAAPIVALEEGVARIGGGNFDSQVDDSKGAEEIRKLAQSFNGMTLELKGHVERLAAETAMRHRIERDLDIAREIQRSLLPTKDPILPGFEIAGWSRAADQTGGDYYDWQTRSTGETIVSLADVTGHGVGPALVTAVCRAYARASFATGRTLPQLFEQLNTLLVADLPEGKFVTYVAILVDPHVKAVQLLSAGHGPILHFTAHDSRLYEYDADELPLGVMADASYGDPRQFQLAPGDFLLLLTDGFFEWPGPSGEQFGLPRLRQTVNELIAQPADLFITALAKRVTDFTQGVPQEDDMTAVMLRYVGIEDQAAART